MSDLVSALRREGERKRNNMRANGIGHPYVVMVETEAAERIEALEEENAKLREEKAQQYQLARYYRTVLQEIRDKTPANCHKEWPHHHWYLAKASAAINHKLEEGGE